jgi:hypothetical protein
VPQNVACVPIGVRNFTQRATLDTLGGHYRCQMPQTRENPDRNFSADQHESDVDVLRLLLERSEVADLPDKGIEERIGRVIARAILAPAKPRAISMSDAAEYRRRALNFEDEASGTEDAQLNSAMVRIALTFRMLANQLERLQDMRDAAKTPATR